MENTQIPDFIPTYPAVERQLLKAIRNHDAKMVLAIVEGQPEVIDNLMDIFPPARPSDLIKTLIKSPELLEWLLFFYPPLPLDRLQGLSSAEVHNYLQRVEEVIGYVPPSLLNGIKKETSRTRRITRFS